MISPPAQRFEVSCHYRLINCHIQWRLYLFFLILFLYPTQQGRRGTTLANNIDPIFSLSNHLRGSSEESSSRSRNSVSSTHNHFHHDPYLPCDRPWPNLTLFLPIYLMTEGPRVHEWEEIFLKSFLFFWPHQYAKTKLLIIVDEEQTHDNNFHTFKHKVNHYASTNMPPVDERADNKIMIKTNNYPSNWYRKGHDRQQLLMLYADEFVDSEYVGFVDTDCEFVTYVDREDLFEDGKPVVNGRIGPVHDWVWYYMPAATKHLLQLDEPMRCMAYFPVIIKTQHIKEMREYIERINGGKSLREVLFLEMIDKAQGRYSQFSFMCAYIWAFHRDEYVWYASNIDPTHNLAAQFEIIEGYWVDPPEGTITNMSVFTRQMLLPKPRVAIHTNYERELTTERNHGILKHGYCISPPYPNRLCDEAVIVVNDTMTKETFYPPSSNGHRSRHPPPEFMATMPYMHRFEDGHFWILYDANIIQIEGWKRYRRLKYCKKEWDFTIYNMTEYPLVLN